MSASALFFMISGARERSYFAFALDSLEKHKNYLFCILGGASQPRNTVYAPSWGITAKKYCICPAAGHHSQEILHMPQLWYKYKYFKLTTPFTCYVFDNTDQKASMQPAKSILCLDRVLEKIHSMPQPRY